MRMSRRVPMTASTLRIDKTRRAPRHALALTTSMCDAGSPADQVPLLGMCFQRFALGHLPRLGRTLPSPAVVPSDVKTGVSLVLFAVPLCMCSLSCTFPACLAPIVRPYRSLGASPLACRQAASLRFGRYCSRATTRRCLMCSWFPSDLRMLRLSHPIKCSGWAGLRTSTICKVTLLPKCRYTSRSPLGRLP